MRTIIRYNRTELPRCASFARNDYEVPRSDKRDEGVRVLVVDF